MPWHRPFGVWLAVVVAVVRGAAAQAVEGVAVSPRIVTGTSTSGFPAAVAILDGGDPTTARTLCTGALVGCRTVLTAAHCLCGQETPARQCAGTLRPRTVFLQHAGFVAVDSAVVHPEYEWPVADLAVLRLAERVQGVPPVPLVGEAPAAGSLGTVVGFGRSGGGLDDYGLKRVGGVVLGPCTLEGLPDTLRTGAALCFDYPGPPAANTCNGDSGGPLFVDAGTDVALAGVTSGGTREDCLAGDRSWNTSVAFHRRWIAEHVGDSADETRACGPGPQAGRSGTTVLGIAGELPATMPGVTHALEVPAGTTRLVVTMNAEETADRADFDLLLAPGREPTPDSATCGGRQPSQYAACTVTSPAAGLWYVRVLRLRGAGRYQVTATMFGVGPGLVPLCGNGVREPGELCDGGDAALCSGGCSPDCTCGVEGACSPDRLSVRRVRRRGGLRVRAWLLDREGELAGLDPTRVRVIVSFAEGSRAVAALIPAGDPGWRRARSGRGWRWRGESGRLRALRLDDRSARRGRWILRIRGTSAPQSPGVDPRRLGLALTLGGRCLAE